MVGLFQLFSTFLAWKSLLNMNRHYESSHVFCQGELRKVRIKHHEKSLAKVGIRLAHFSQPPWLNWQIKAGNQKIFNPMIGCLEMILQNLIPPCFMASQPTPP